MTDLEKKIAEEQAKVDQLKRLAETFPDLKEDQDRWKTKRYYSKLVNSQALDVDRIHSCGCCSDAPYYAMPYIEFEGIRIYSNPPRFYLGEGSWSGPGHSWDGDWAKKMEVAGINKRVIDIVKIEQARDEAGQIDDEENG